MGGNRSQKATHDKVVIRKVTWYVTPRTILYPESYTLVGQGLTEPFLLYIYLFLIDVYRIILAEVLPEIARS